MGQHSDQPLDIDPATLQHSQALWHHFTVFAKYGVIAVAAILFGMWLLLV